MSARRVVAIFSTSLLVAWVQGAWAQGEAQYELTEDRIETARVVDQGEGTFAVVIQLTPRATQEFAALTEANVGRRLAIVKSGRVLIRPVVRGRIDSGGILIPWNSEAEAKAFLDTLPLRPSK